MTITVYVCLCNADRKVKQVAAEARTTNKRRLRRLWVPRAVRANASEPWCMLRGEGLHDPALAGAD